MVDEPLQFKVALLDYNDYVGRIGVGRVLEVKCVSVITCHLLN